MKTPEPVAWVEETNVGAKVYVYGVEIAWSLGCPIGTMHDEKKKVLVKQINDAAPKLEEGSIVLSAEEVEQVMEALRIGEGKVGWSVRQTGNITSPNLNKIRAAIAELEKYREKK